MTKLVKMKEGTPRWEKIANSIARDIAPNIVSCKSCGGPVPDGYCCNRCGDEDPTGGSKR